MKSGIEIHTNYLKDSNTYDLSDQDFSLSMTAIKVIIKLVWLLVGLVMMSQKLIAASCYGYLNQFRTDMNETHWDYSPHLFDETHYKPYTPGYTIMNSEVMGE